ncbi:MAG TPA: MurR/RpiR family transcriptional regulator [Anaerolineae bacterium]|nr:MurR/RpiR family transcriptional regulator [Anaerolineae bacterium]
MFRERIKVAYADLSPSFQRLADYLMDHPYEAAFMTATQLGKQLDVDTATVVRFAQKLGYPGYPELLDEVQAEVRVQLSRYFQPVPSEGDALDVFRATVRQAVANIEQFDLATDNQTIERIVSLIESVDRVWVVGEGTSGPMAELLAYTLNGILDNAARLSAESGAVATVFHKLSPHDLVIAVAVTEYCPDVTSVMQVARERGAQTVALIGAQSWPVARAADVVMLCPSNNTGRLSSLYSSYGVAIDALAQTLFFKRRDRLAGKLAEFDQVLRQLNEARNAINIEPAPLPTEVRVPA